ncbi:hypothetical protein [Kitasatospora purpeofusca]|uniref:hypothetical protein n=1 Tax=Kitasatospora purpeofusca TaxID=67352 RepID=UPI002A59E120|nr:hypothetical protein [Kitasatospora purpeofusca]MDY0809897.1 hypothetical protein [Kitasatospora purpeofusca]
MSDLPFIAYMTAFQVSVKHTADCEPCLNMEPCPTGDPLHNDFAAKQAVWTSEQRVQAANERRRAKRRADSRARIARHTAWQLVTYGRWEGGRPLATATDVVRNADLMYGGHLKGESITTTEAAAALAAILKTA